MALTGKLKKFADAVLAGLSNRNAAIEAGYSAATASQAGSRLVKDKRVVQYLAERRAAVGMSPRSAPPATESDPGEQSKYDDPKAFLIDAMNDSGLEDKLRVDAAKALMPFTHVKLGEGGKKDGKSAAAKSAGTGRFGPAAPPRLATAGGKKV